jgi:hypothetical protein
MTANTFNEETSLIDLAIEQLVRDLPAGITVERSNRTLPAPPGASEPRRVADMIDIRTQNGMTTLLVEAKKAIAPRDAKLLFSGQLESLATMTGTRFLVVSPWLSPQTRTLLNDRRINYLDLTGNTFISLDNPVIYIRTDGASRDPAPADRPPARLRGPKAGRLVRFLVDVQPPYGIRELATATNLTPGYLSRLVETLDRDALITRKDRGPVESVDVPRLLARYAQTYDVFKTNETRTFIAKRGAADAMSRISSLESRTAVTGSFSAVRFAPVAAPALLAVYCDNIRAVAEELDLLPADSGANVALLRPFDSVVWDRTQRDQDTEFVSPSQTALDCLTGNGRMPAEGEALLGWLTQNEPQWRLPSIKVLAP